MAATLLPLASEQSFIWYSGISQSDAVIFWTMIGAIALLVLCRQESRIRWTIPKLRSDSSLLLKRCSTRLMEASDFMRWLRLFIWTSQSSEDPLIVPIFSSRRQELLLSCMSTQPSSSQKNKNTEFRALSDWNGLLDFSYGNSV